MQRIIGFVVKPCLVDFFVYLDRMFNLLVPPRFSFLPSVATPSHFRPVSRAADESTAASTGRHSTSAYFFFEEEV